MNNRPAQEKMEQQASNGENLMPMLAASAASRLVRDILGRLNSPYAEAAARPMRPALLWRQVARRLGLLQEQSSASFLPAPNSGTPRPHFIWRARPLRRALSEDGQWTEEPVLTLGPQIEPGRHVTSVVAPVVAPPVIVPVQSSPALALPAEATADSLPDVTPAAAPRSALTSSPALAGPTTEPLPAPDVAMPDEVAQSHLGPSLAEPAASIQPATSSDIAPQAPATPNIMTPPDVARPIEQAMSTGAPQRSSVPLPAAAADLLQPPTFIMPDAQQSRDSTGAQRAEQLSVTPTEMQPQASETRPHEAAAPAPLPSATLPFDTSAQSAPSLPAAFETGQAAESAPPRFVPTRVVRVTYTQGPAVALPAPLANANTSISRPGIATPLVARLYGAEPLPAFGDPPQSAGQAEFTHARSTSQRRRQSVTLEEAPFAQVSDDSNVARVAFTRRPIIAADNPLVPAADLLARMEYRSVLEAARSDEPMEQPPEQLVGDLSLHQQIVAAAASAEAPTPLPMPLAAPGTRQPSALQVDSLSQSTQPARGPVARMLDKALAVLPLPQSLRRAANPDVQEMPSVVQSHELLSNAPAPATSYIPPQVEALPTDNPVQLPVVEQRTIGEAGHEASMRAATPADFTQEEYRPIVQPDLISAIDSSSYVPAEESATHAGSPNYSAEANQSTALQPAATEADSLPAPLAVSVPAGSSPESAAQAVPGGGESGAASLTPPVVGTPAVPSVPPATSANFYVLPVQPVEETTTTSQSPGEALTGVSDEPVERVGTQGFVGAIINRLLRRADAPAETESSGSQPLSMPWRRSSRQQKANKVDYTNFEDLSGGAATPQPSKSEDRADVFPSRELSLGSTRASYSEPAPSVTATAAYGPDSSPVAAPIQAAPANLAAFESTDVAPILDATSTTAPPLDATAPALADPPSVAAPEALAGEAIGWPGVASQVNVPKASREATFDVSEDLFSPPQVEEGAEVEASRMQEATYTPPQPSFSFSVDEGAEPDAAASEVWASMPEVAQEVSRAHVPLTGFSPLITVLRSGGLLGRVYGSRAAATVPGQEELVSEGQRATRSASEVPSATPVNYAAGSPATGVLGTPT
ncbi:MAG: hypothetical protein IVW55_08445, partial [Chloroflexi bacterium]|nr:hypothetical protein [Chloroflexota bacterium]